MQEYDYSSLCNEALVISLRKKVIRREQLSICEAKGGLRMLQFARYREL